MFKEWWLWVRQHNPVMQVSDLMGEIMVTVESVEDRHNAAMKKLQDVTSAYKYMFGDYKENGDANNYDRNSHT